MFLLIFHPCDRQFGQVSVRPVEVTEIFLSIQGEGTDAGRLCTFVRFTGCNVRCVYCDTDYAFYNGQDVSLDDIVEKVLDMGAPMVCLTGGEPMLQKEIVPLMGKLLDANLDVVLETNGVIPLQDVPEGVTKVMDVKTPRAFRSKEDGGQGQGAPFHLPNLDVLHTHDQVKFVLCDRSDYEWALEFVREHRLHERVNDVLFSPSQLELEPQRLVSWMTQDNPPVRLNLQLHKYIWGPDVRGV